MEDVTYRHVVGTRDAAPMHARDTAGWTFHSRSHVDMGSIAHAAPASVTGSHQSTGAASSVGAASTLGAASEAASGVASGSATSGACVSALELGRHNIRVNSVNPTVVMTKMSAFYWGRPEIGEPFLNQMPLHRWATEDDIAAPIVFLLGDGAAMISGVSLPIDGGFTAC